tara:strand:- start:165 stop:476 length:312 start_codon:yes stop_codon:yes gene_type:complete
MSETQIVRLSTGEEIVAKVTENEDSYTLKRPAILIPAGRDQLAFGQWLPYADIENGIEISKKYVVFIIPPMTELANQYSSSFGSGIVVPEKGPIAGASLKLST